MKEVTFLLDFNAQIDLKGLEGRFWLAKNGMGDAMKARAH